MLIVGIDLGSRYVKIVTYDTDSEKVDNHIYETVSFYKENIVRNGETLFIDTDKLFRRDDIKVVATGYGRNLLEFKNAEIISEIKAHFYGALKSTKLDNFTLIDIGGQDSKVILAKDGYIEDFIMNDKCAASTGRFLEQASTTLGVTIEELSSMVANPINITVTCSVFAESEIISLIATGKKIEEIGAGINLSIAKRLSNLLQSRLSNNIYASGGVAKNSALIHFISEILDEEVKALENSQFNGANGCIKIY